MSKCVLRPYVTIFGFTHDAVVEAVLPLMFLTRRGNIYGIQFRAVFVGGGASTHRVLFKPIDVHRHQLLQQHGLELRVMSWAP